MKKYVAFLLFLSFMQISGLAQDTINWDNQLYLGNKVTWGQARSKYSLEVQTRFRDNTQSLDNYYLEFVSSYLVSHNFELVPDLRFTVKPTKVELRPAFGLLYKVLGQRWQFVNQVKYQLDFASKGENGQALREVIFVNRTVNDKFLITSVAGFIYRWWPSWNGFQYVRVGLGMTYRIDDKLLLNFNYFVGTENQKGKIIVAGIPVIQLVLNVSNTYKYTPAYYFSF